MKRYLPTLTLPFAAWWQTCNPPPRASFRVAPYGARRQGHVVSTIFPRGALPADLQREREHHCRVLRAWRASPVRLVAEALTAPGLGLLVDDE